MIILDRPYVSEELKQYLSLTQVPVLKNDTALRCRKNSALNIVSEERFLQLYAQGRRLYTCSENSIDWIVRNIRDEKLLGCIERMKDKALFRELLAPAYPDFFFRQATLEELPELDPDRFSYPFVLKPKVGFFSVGVYPIICKDDWDAALFDLTSQADDWKKSYPTSVVNTEFILEQYVYGEEFAIDAYYDENGEAVVLNILKHDFGGITDVSDRLYYTGKSIIEQYLDLLSTWLTEVNRYFKITDFPFHAEVRIDNGRITPIEFNPMRFAGWCCTDISCFAFGFYTYDYYYGRQKPDWSSLLKGKDGKHYTFIILDKSNVEIDSDEFDYDAACWNFGKVLCLRKIDFHQHPIYGFAFTEIDENDERTRRRITETNFDLFAQNVNRTKKTAIKTR